jgi:cytochrome c556
MNSVGWSASLLGVLVVGALVLSQPSKPNTPTVKEIMTKAHKGGNALITKLSRELREDKPNWQDIQEQTTQLVNLGKFLAQNDPPRGEKESWQRYTREYLQNAKKLDDAAQVKDKETASALRDKIGRSCSGCHRFHRPS